MQTEPVADRPRISRADLGDLLVVHRCLDFLRSLDTRPPGHGPGPRGSPPNPQGSAGSPGKPSGPGKGQRRAVASGSSGHQGVDVEVGVSVVEGVLVEGVVVVEGAVVGGVVVGASAS